ncbi:phosphatase PAP2 family protein [Sphaerimonospora cavernae]|uniref:Phosphatase PAP2 family protein n=1 Tax=Sphaerimonospora cavernae TaxID=1740611 RepID=A0ABV6TZ79_9ACTN
MWPVARRLAAWDHALLTVVVNRRRPDVTRLARLVTLVGEPAVMAFPVLVTCVRGRRWRPIVVFTSGLAVRAVLSRLIGRARPPQSWWLAEPTGPSLPSRHTATATLGALLLGEQLGRGHAVQIAVVIAGSVGASRIYLGVHWPTDVAAGAAFGVLWWALGVMDFRNLHQQPQTLARPCIERSLHTESIRG